MSAFVCDHGASLRRCSARAAARRWPHDVGVPLLARIPLEPAVAAGGDDGEPVALGDGPGGRGVPGPRRAHRRPRRCPPSRWPAARPAWWRPSTPPSTPRTPPEQRPSPWPVGGLRCRPAQIGRQRRRLAGHRRRSSSAVAWAGARLTDVLVVDDDDLRRDPTEAAGAGGDAGLDPTAEAAQQQARTRTRVGGSSSSRRSTSVRKPGVTSSTPASSTSRPSTRLTGGHPAGVEVGLDPGEHAHTGPAHHPRPHHADEQRAGRRWGARRCRGPPAR